VLGAVLGGKAYEAIAAHRRAAGVTPGTKGVPLKELKTYGIQLEMPVVREA